MEEENTFNPDWYKKHLKSVLNDLLERADEIIDTAFGTQATEAQIRIDIKGGEIPTYTVEANYFPKKLF